MLLQNFYAVESIESDKDAFSATVTIQKEHPIFKGHFPDFPVTPGVAMLQILKELTEEHLQKDLFLQTASTIKFLAVVNPNINAILKFDITFEEDAQLIKIKNTTSFTDGTPVLKCNVTFTKR